MIRCVHLAQSYLHEIFTGELKIGVLALQMRVAGVKLESVTDGPGIRTVVYFQGCPHSCPGCHNPDTHDSLGGSLAEVADLAALVNANPLSAGITLSGGEPFSQPAAAAELAALVKASGRTVWAYSGYTLEELLQEPAAREVLRYVDVLVDGPFVIAQRDHNLTYRGSANQRILTSSEWQHLLK